MDRLRNVLRFGRADDRPASTGDDGMNRSRILFMCWAFLVTVLFVPSGSLAQPGGFGGPFGGGGGLIGLLMREDVQQEIQLVDEQRDKVMTVAEDVRDKMREEMRGMFEQMRELSDDERRERFGEIRSKMEQMNADVETQLKKALLPHQLQRLKQIDLQVRMQSRGEGGLSSRAVADALELSDDQREKLEQRAEEVRRELQEKIRQAQAEAREKMLDVLTPEQKAKLEELTGDVFQMSDENRFFGRGGFRDRERGERGNDQGRERRDADEAI
jgi:Spy/CpxP family protein refolding chaperone